MKINFTRDRAEHRPSKEASSDGSTHNSYISFGQHPNINHDEDSSLAPKPFGKTGKYLQLYSKSASEPKNKEVASKSKAEGKGMLQSLGTFCSCISRDESKFARIKELKSARQDLSSLLGPTGEE
jgi:hypothetical protein